jgi:CO/xanthine dehydrogenase FAD-binding subunit
LGGEAAKTLTNNNKRILDSVVGKENLPASGRRARRKVPPAFQEEPPIPMNLWSDYILSTSIDEALQALSAAPGPARPVAGGTDLLLDLQQGHTTPVHTLVDISRIPELQVLELRGDRLYIGAGVPVSAIASSPLVIQHAQAVAEACALIGGPQVRNTATLGGNVAHALPAADGTIGLVALDAAVEIAGLGGRRIVPILELFRGVGRTIICDTVELVVGFHLPLRKTGQGSAFFRVMRPQGVALPVINLAAWLERQGDQITAVRIGVGPAGTTPQRAQAIETALCGQPFGPPAVQKAQALVDDTLHFRSSAARATAAYRYQLCKILLEDALTAAWERSLLPVED